MLADNLRRTLTGRPLVRYVPQSTYLSLISAGRRYAIGDKGWLTFEGAWAWRLKDYIDRAFMRKFGRCGALRRVLGVGFRKWGARIWA